MAGMRIPDTPIGGQRLRGVPDVNVSPRITADDMGGREAAENRRLGEAIQYAGDTLQRYGQRVYEEQAENEAREALTTYKTDISRYREKIFTNYRGDQAYKTRDDLEEYSAGQAKSFAKGLKTPRAQELFDKHRMDYDAHNRTLADGHVLREHENYRMTSLQADNSQLLNEAAALPGDPAAVMHSIERMKANNAQLYRGAPPQFLALRNGESAMAVTETVAANLTAKYGPGAALAFLDVQQIKDMFTPAQHQALYSKQAKFLQAEAKKQAENQMRQLGISLGEKYDSEIDIIRALTEVDDRELANIARTEAEIVRKARMLEKEAGAKTTDAAKKEFEEESARTKAAAIGGAARSEEEIHKTVDAMEDVPEAYRQRVADMAVTRMKARQSAEALQQMELEKQLTDELAAGNWDPSTISKDLPGELQVKLSDIANKMHKRGGEAPLPDTEYWEELMAKNPEDLRLQMRKPGEMAEMKMRLGGNTPWWNDVERRARGELSAEEKAAAAAAKKGPAAFSLADVKEADLKYARQAYGDDFQRRSGGTLPDEKAEAEKIRQTQFDMRAREALANAMNGAGRELTPLETKGVIYSLLTNFKYTDEGWFYDSLADVPAFAVASEPDKYPGIRLTNPETGAIVTGQFGGEIYYEPEHNITYENVSSLKTHLPQKVKDSARINEGTVRLYDRKLFVVSYGQVREFYDIAGKPAKDKETGTHIFEKVKKPVAINPLLDEDDLDAERMIQEAQQHADMFEEAAALERRLNGGTE